MVGWANHHAAVPQAPGRASGPRSGRIPPPLRVHRHALARVARCDDDPLEREEPAAQRVGQQPQPLQPPRPRVDRDAGIARPALRAHPPRRPVRQPDGPADLLGGTGADRQPPGLCDRCGGPRGVPLAVVALHHDRGLHPQWRAHRTHPVPGVPLLPRRRIRPPRGGLLRSRPGRVQPRAHGAVRPRAGRPRGVPRRAPAAHRLVEGCDPAARVRGRRGAVRGAVPPAVRLARRRARAHRCPRVRLDARVRDGYADLRFVPLSDRPGCRAEAVLAAELPLPPRLELPVRGSRPRRVGLVALLADEGAAGLLPVLRGGDRRADRLVRELPDLGHVRVLAAGLRHARRAADRRRGRAAHVCPEAGEHPGAGHPRVPGSALHGHRLAAGPARADIALHLHLPGNHLRVRPLRPGRLRHESRAAGVSRGGASTAPP